MKVGFLNLLFASICFLFSTSLLGQTQDIEKLKKQLAEAPNDSTKAILLSDICWKYRGISVDSSISYGKKAINFCQKTANNKELATAFNNLAVAWWSKGNYDSAKFYLTKATQQYKKNKFPKGQFATLINLGLINQNLGNLEESLKNLFRSIEIQDSLKTSKYLQSTYNNIGNVYTQLENWEKAKTYYQKAYKAGLSQDPQPYLARIVQNIGMVYRNLKAYDSAIFYLKIGEKTALEKNDNHLLGNIYLNYANVYLDLKQKKPFFKASRNALKYISLNGNNYFLNMAHNIMASGFSSFGQYDSAISHSNKAIEIAQAENNHERLMGTYKTRNEVEEKFKRYNKANNYLKKYYVHKDSILNEEKQKAISELEIVHQTYQKEKQLTENKLEIQTQKATIASQKNTQILLISGIGFIILGGLLFYNRSKAINKQKLQKAVLKEKEKGFAGVIRASEEERKRISKDLHDGVGQQMSALKMALSNFTRQETNDEKKSELNKIINNFTKSADEIRHISHQMMPKALMDNGLKEAIEDLLIGSFEFSDIQYQFEHHDINTRFDERIEISVYRVLQELINNVIKHSNATMVNVQLLKTGKKLVLFVEDNGKGIGNTSTKGHGILNIKSRIDMIHGTVNYEPSPSSGTIATVTIPLS